MLLLPVGYVAGHYWVNMPRDGELPFYDSIADGNLRAWSGFDMRHLCCSHSAQVLDPPDRSNGLALRFTLNHDDPDVKGSRRAELRLHAAEFGRTYEYKVGSFVPGEWVGDPVPVTVVQWHNVPELWSGESGLGPLLKVPGVAPMLKFVGLESLLAPGVQGSVLSVNVEGDEWVVGLEWGRGPSWLDHKGDIHTATLWHGKLDRNRWVNWDFRVKWSYEGDGAIDILKDNDPIVRYEGPTSYVGTLAPYLKIGLYVPAWKVFPDSPTETNRRQIWFRDIQMKQM
jgi:hypothetical protein